MRSRTFNLAAIAVTVLVSRATASDLVDSGFEPGQTWNGTSWVVAAAWPDSFRGGYALHVKDSQQFKKWPLTGTMSETLLSIRMHFRVQSDNLSLDPNHDDVPFEQIELLGVQPKNAAGKRPAVALRRNDDMLILRVGDYSKFQFLREVVVVPDRWHVLDLLVDQNNTRMTVALDGLTVYDDPAADLHPGTPFTIVDFGVIYSQKNGHSIWIDDVRIRDSGGLQGPELLATATATPGVGVVPLATTFTVNTSAGSPTIEWDFEGDGVFDASGYTANKTYSTVGTYRPVARVTNSSGRAAAYPPVIHATSSNAPAVTLTVENGGSASLPFPRVLDFRADATPVSGSKVTKVEFDWDGGGVYGWSWRTSWSDPLQISVRLPHDFPFDTTSAVVRAKVTDDSGRLGAGELVVSLPIAPGNPTIPPRDARAGIYFTYGWPEMYKNRGNALPGWVAGADVGAFFEWSTIEASDGVFDFGPLNGSIPTSYNGRITQIVNSGKNVVLHHRAYFPSWLFTKVGKSKKTNPEGNYYPQFWDPRYQVYLRRFVQASAGNLQALIALHPTWANRFVINRGQSFNIDSESVPTGQSPVIAYPGTSYSLALTPSNFTPPASGAYPVDYTPELASAYAATVRAIYDDAFSPLGVPSVFKPVAGGWLNGWDTPRTDREHRRSVSNASQGFFVTCSQADTCQEFYFLGYTDKGYAEGFHEAAGSDPLANNDSVQWQYWTLLSQLNCGSEFVGTYGDFAWYLEYQSEFESEAIHAFVNRHVGWEPFPAQAPAAWIALKPPTASHGNPFSVGNYSAMLTELPDAGADLAAVDSIQYTYTGPTNLGHPTTLNEPMMWARDCPAAKRLNFAVDDAFRDAHTNNFDLEVVFLDSYQGQFFVRCKNQRGVLKYFVVPMSGDGKWHRAVVALNSVQLRNDLGGGGDFALEADAQATTFHRLVLTPR